MGWLLMVFDVYSINSANVKFTRRVRDEPANRLNRGHNGVKKSTLVKNKCEISLKCMFFYSLPVVFTSRFLDD